ncbi:hypothetical protein DOTSEDRAFT_39411 [Dothistroma septosporum NZE10]|uniref:2EXR domain-containing protein n=1 Tax=Dothistroma septosporum (strain NZE10 / CBS 128990) TaxID=675120 RepID=N1PBJ1_DOTSN|nr:hypothetical protein DOTSEDRAFT_39411 [Dothistroma septosporum NZE10]
MDRSPISKLPAELRNRIFELALHQDRIVLRPYPPDPEVTSSPTRRRLYLSKETNRQHFHPTALAQTCRQLHNETTAVFYSTNIFVVNTWRHDYPALITQLRHAISPANSAALRKLILYQRLGSGLTSTIPLDKAVMERSLEAGNHGDVSEIEIHYHLGDGVEGILRSGGDRVSAEIETLAKHCTEMQRLGNRDRARGAIEETECLKRFWCLNNKKQSLRLARRVLSKR